MTPEEWKQLFIEVLVEYTEAQTEVVWDRVLGEMGWHACWKGGELEEFAWEFLESGDMG